MLVVVNQPHTDGFRIEGNIPKDILDYVEAKSLIHALDKGFFNRCYLIVNVI